MLVLFSSFVFFKQKTAYEMRISDWSSDVCSSDLLARIAVLEQRAVAAAADALDECRNVGIEPDGQAVLQDQCARLVVDEGTAAGGQDERPAGEQPRDHPALALAKIALAKAREDVGDGHAGGALRTEEHTSELQSLMRSSY